MNADERYRPRRTTAEDAKDAEERGGNMKARTGILLAAVNDSGEVDE
jgi:hypothetical protein